MNSFFFVTFLSLGVMCSGYAHSYIHGAAPLGPDGRVIDTPEVAHAKAAHLAAKAAAGSHGIYAPAIYAAAPVAYAHYAHGAAPIGHDGRVVDTPEVAHAKAAHFAAKAAAGSHSVYAAAPAIYAPAVYAAAPAYIASAHAYGPAPLGHDGRVIDTPEVAHAKAAHLAAKAAAGAHESYAPAIYSAAPVAYATHYAHGAAPIGHDGRVVDTPEVAHAKAAHFAAKAAAGAHHY